VAFSPDGTRVATGSRDQTARVWDAATGEELLVLRGHEAPVKSVAYSPDGAYIATASHDTTAKLWDANTGKLRADPMRHSERLWTVGFSPDGRSLITASEDRTARTVDLAGVATASEDRTACVWDADTGRPLMELRGHAGAVNAAAISPDGQMVATGGDDGAARVYPLTVHPTLEDLLARARQRVTRELTPEERVKYLREGTEATDAEPPPEIVSL